MISSIEQHGTSGAIIEFTPEKVERLRVCYQKAVKAKAETFMFDNHELVTSYGKYLLEYLDMRLSKEW